MNYKKHIEGLQKGSYNDFKILYDLFYNRLYGFVFALTKSESTTKDIVQETFIKLWINRENINTEIPLKSYLFSISKNTIIDEFRKQIAKPIFEDYYEYTDSLKSKDVGADQQMDFDQFQAKIEAAKMKLTNRQREIFELSKEQGLSTKEIAETLNISVQTIYNILSSAIKIMKKEIGYLGIMLFSLFFE